MCVHVLHWSLLSYRPPLSQLTEELEMQRQQNHPSQDLQSTSVIQTHAPPLAKTAVNQDMSAQPLSLGY